MILATSQEGSRKVTVSDLVPTQQKQVVFYEAEITAVLINGNVYASLNSMCDALELDRQAQRRRIDRNDVLSDGLGVAIIATPKGGQQSTYVLRADLVPHWACNYDPGTKSTTATL